MTAPQHSDTCPALHHLQAISWRVKQATVDQDRPALPRPVHFPKLRYANMDPPARPGQVTVQAGYLPRLLLGPGSAGRQLEPSHRPPAAPPRRRAAGAATI